MRRREKDNETGWRARRERQRDKGAPGGRHGSAAGRCTRGEAAEGNRAAGQPVAERGRIERDARMLRVGCNRVARPAMRDAMAQPQRQRQQQCDRQEDNENRPPLQAAATWINHGSAFPAPPGSVRSRQRSREGPGYLASCASRREHASSGGSQPHALAAGLAGLNRRCGNGKGEPGATESDSSAPAGSSSLADAQARTPLQGRWRAAPARRRELQRASCR